MIDYEKVFILNSRDMLSLAGVHNPKRFFYKEISHFLLYDKLDELFENINFSFLEKYQYIIYLDPQDICNFDDLYDRKLEPYIISEKIREVGLEDKLYFASCNLLDNYKNIKHLPVVTFISSCNSKSVELNFDRKFDKKFLFLNRKYRIHRENVYNFLKDKDILKQCMYSYNSFNEELPNYTPLKEDLSFLFPEKTNPSDHITSKTFCSILTETHFYEKDYSARLQLTNYGEVIFPTEKLDRVLMYGHPFIAVSNYKFLDKLKQLGFKTFDRWWDESYDLIQNDEERMSAILKVIEEVSTWSEEKCYSTLSEMKQILQHNSFIRSKIRQVKDKYPIPDYWNANLSDFIFLENLTPNL